MYTYVCFVFVSRFGSGKASSKRIRLEQNENQDIRNTKKGIRFDNFIKSEYSPFNDLSQSSGSRTLSIKEHATQGSSAQELFKDITVTPENEQSNDKYSTTSSADHVELPKKRWLREAVQDQQRWDSNQELASPINWGDEVSVVEYENQRRPTVLMRVQEDGEGKQVSRADIQLAMALVEFKNGKPYEFQF